MWGFVAGLGKAVVSPLIQPSITPLAPVDVTANSLAVQPQVDASGILSRIPVIGGLIERVWTGLSDWSGSLLGGLSEVWTRYAAFWDMMRVGAQDTVAALRQAAVTTLPAILGGTLSLTPVLTAELPTPATVTTTTMRAVETPPSTMVAPMAMRVPEAVVMEMPELALPVLGPSAAVAAIAEKPVPSVVKEREIERTRLLVEHAGASVPAEHGKAAPGEPETSMGALMAKLDEIAERPVDINLTVVSKLDGRIIAQAVYKDIRQQKIKNYETL